MSEPRTEPIRPADRLHLLPRHREMLLALLREHLPGIEVWAYGSRLNGQSHDGSDLDLVLRSPDLQKIPIGQVGDFREALRESNIPFLVEARDWARLPESFHPEIEREYVVLVEKEKRDDASEWPTIRFTDAVQINPPVRLERGKAYPFVDMATVNAGFRSAYALERRVYSGGGTRFRSGDTLMARITPCLENGKIARYCAPDPTDPAHGSTEFIVIRGRPDVTDHEFAYYLTQWEEVRHYAIGQMTGTSGRQRVPTKALDHLSVTIPPLLEQRAIAHILGTLDDKIELNRRMNETLEAMARALFRSWFVDFDPVRAKMEGRDTGLPKPISDLFPDRLVDSERGEIPQGWKAGRLADIAIAPRRNVDPASLDDETPYIGLEHMPRRSIALTTWERIGKVTSNKSIFKKGEVLFGRLRPYFHKVGVAPINGACSTDIAVIASKSTEWSAFVLACVSSTQFVSYTNQGSTGTKMPRTNWMMMGDYRTCLPILPAVRAFQNAMQPMLEQIIANVHESRTLAGMRDALLPKLISGEMRVRDAEKIIGVVT